MELFAYATQPEQQPAGVIVEGIVQIALVVEVRLVVVGLQVERVVGGLP
jgi:hypothetical protein